MLLFCGGFLFLCLIIPPPGGGGVNKDCLPAGPFFFALNQPAPVGADEINIPCCRGGYKCFRPSGCFFFACGRKGVAPAGASCFLSMSIESSQRTPLKERGISNFPLSLRILSP